jgi:iron complex outermembrane receptor protein
MKQILLIAAFVIGSLSIYAQKSMKGRVVDATTNKPLNGATISFQNKEAVKSDADGIFSIDCNKNTRITISFVGYESKQQAVNCNDDLIISLIPSNSTLSNVEITATSAQNKSILYQPQSITKLNSTELKRSTGLYLDDAINTNVPGVTMQRRAVSSGQQINIRGYGNGVRGTNGVSSNFDIQGTKVYLNGIPLTDAEGITVLDDIDFNSIGNVEVVKGPSGTLYGLAIAGVVNLNTIQPEKGKTSVGQDVLIGNYGTQRYTTHLQTATVRSSILVNYGNQKSDGFMVHTASTKHFVNVAGNIQANEKQSIGFYGGYSNSYDERAGELTITQYQNKDYSGNPAYIQRNAHSNIISVRLGVSHTYDFTDHFSNTTTVFGTGMTSNASSAGGWTDKNPVNYGLRSNFNSKFTVGKGLSLSGITGIEMQRQNAQVIGYFMSPNPVNPSGYYRIDTIRSNQYYTTSTKSLFTEWTLALPKDLSFTAGVGWSTMNIDLNDRFVRPNYTRPTHFEQDYRNMVSPHLAVNKVFSKELSVYAAYSKGYKAPVSSYFFIPVNTGNAFLDSTLKPEIGNQFEVGSKGSLLKDRLVYQLAVFNAIFSDKMTAIAVPLNPPAVGTAYSYVANGGKVNNKGLEVSVKYTAYQSGRSFFSLVRPFANFTYSKFRYEDFKIQALNAARTAIVETDYSGKDVAGVPPITFNVGVDVNTLPGIYLNAYYSYRDEVYLTSVNDESQKAKAFGLLNAKVGFRRSLSSHFDLDASVGASNIGGVQYYNMIFVNQLPDAYLPAPLKTVYFGAVGLKYNF